MSKKEIKDREEESFEREKRHTRMDETRDAEARAAAERAILNMNYKDLLALPAGVSPPDGMEYGWIRESTLGTPDHNRQIEAAQIGWRAVPGDRHPQFNRLNITGKVINEDGVIRRKGLVLCERDLYLGKLEREQMAQMNLKIMTDNPATNNFMGEPVIPGSTFRSDSQTYTSKGIR